MSIRDPEPTHPRVAEAYKHLSAAEGKKITTRKDGAMLAQLRAGHCMGLAHYRNRVDPTQSATCGKCGEEEETVEHWISCPATTNIRRRTFGQAWAFSLET